MYHDEKNAHQHDKRRGYHGLVQTLLVGASSRSTTSSHSDHEMGHFLGCDVVGIQVSRRLPPKIVTITRLSATNAESLADTIADIVDCTDKRIKKRERIAPKSLSLVVTSARDTLFPPARANLLEMYN